MSILSSMSRPPSFASGSINSSTDKSSIDKPRKGAMDKISDFLADGVRANEERDAVNEVIQNAPTRRGTSPTSFSKRMGKRSHTDKSYHEERVKDRGSPIIVDREREINVDQAVPEYVNRAAFYRGHRLDRIAELEGDDVSTAAASRTATPSMSATTSQKSISQVLLDRSNDTTALKRHVAFRKPNTVMPRSESMPLTVTSMSAIYDGRRDSLPLIQLRDVTLETRKHIFAQEAAKKRLKKEIGRRQAKELKASKSIEQGLSPGNHRIDDHSLHVGVLNAPLPGGACLSPSRYLAIPTMEDRAPDPMRDPLFPPRSPMKRLAPRKAVTLRPGTQAVTIGRADFNLIRPSASSGSSYTGSAPPIPPRNSSREATFRHFSVLYPDQPPYRLRAKAKLDTLPVTVAAIIYRRLMVADHDVLVCSCGVCSWSASKQPALARVCRKIRSEALPIFYGENKFVIRHEDGSPFGYRDAAPAWLRALTVHSRDMIHHVELGTLDLASAVCMMATLNFRLSHRLPRKYHLGLMNALEIEKTELQLTFTAINKNPTPEEREEQRNIEDRMSKARKRVSTVSSLDLWDEDGSPYPVVDGTTEADNDDTLRTNENDAGSSAASVTTAILDLNGYSDRHHTFDAIIQQGNRARQSRGRVVTLPEGDVAHSRHASYASAGGSSEKEKLMGELANFWDRANRRYLKQRAVTRPRSTSGQGHGRVYSLRDDLLRAASPELVTENVDSGDQVLVRAGARDMLDARSNSAVREMEARRAVYCERDIGGC